jgi:hypothetical protein
MEQIKTAWKNIVTASNRLVTNYKAGGKIPQNEVKSFVDCLVNLSVEFVSKREDFLIFLRDNYHKMFLPAVNLMSSADSVAVIMQANEGINDYLILVNVFRSLLVSLDTMASGYWLKQSEIYAAKGDLDQDVFKKLIQKANYAIFNKTEEEEIAITGIKDDEYFRTIMNQDLWKEIEALDHKYILKNQENFEYFQQLLIATDQLADDMVINLWAVLAVGFSYIDYLNNRLN